MIQSPCEIRFTPAGGSATVLVAAGDWLEDVPDITAKQAVLERDGVLSQRGHIRPLGKVTVDIALMIHQEHATAAAAQAAFLAAESLPEAGVLAFVFPDETASYDAVLPTRRPGMPGWPVPCGTRELRFRCAYPPTIS